MTGQKESVMAQPSHSGDAIYGRRSTSMYRETICRAFSSQNSQAFLDIMSVRHLTRGQMIFDEPHQLDSLAVVASGLVKLIYPLPDGRQQIVDLLSNGDTLWRRNPSTQVFLAEATCDSDVCIFTGRSFAAALGAHPKEERALHSKALDNLEGARTQLLVLGRMSSMEKVATVLIKLAYAGENLHHSSKPSGSTLPLVLLPMTRLEMADYLGLTVETVCRTITKLKLAGLIRLVDTRTIELCDPDGMKAIAECRRALCH